MRRLVVVVGVSLSLIFASTALAASGTARFSSSYAVEGSAHGGGSVIYKSGTPNYLRATAHGDVIQTFPMLVTVSIRQGSITSSTVKYTGANGGTIRWSTSGAFSRTLSGGISIANGAIFKHTIFLELVDQTQGNKVLGVWTHVNDTIVCGGLVYPVGLGGCNDATSDSFGSPVNLTTTSSSVKKNDLLKVRVRVASVIQAMGIGIGLDAKTQASGLSAKISW